MPRNLLFYLIILFLATSPFTTTSKGEAVKNKLVEQIYSDQEFNQTLHAQKWTFVDFYAPWCPHCQKLAPIFEETAQMLNEKKVDDVKLVGVNCDRNAALCRRTSFRYYPTLILYKDGVRFNTYSGVHMSITLVRYLLKKKGVNLDGNKILN